MNFASRHPSFLSWPAIVAAVVFCAMLGLRPVVAGPLTGGAGNPPYQKLSVYQGIVAIAPTGTDTFRLGANGTDIASTTSITLRPGNGGIVTVAHVNTTSLGGQVTLMSSAAGASDWTMSSAAGNLRFMAGASVKLTINQSGDLTALGTLCLNNSGCHAKFSEISGSGTTNQSLDDTLKVGNIGATTPIPDSTNHLGYIEPVLFGLNEPFPYMAGSALPTNFGMVSAIVATGGNPYDHAAGGDLPANSLNTISAKSNKPLGLNSGSAVYAANPNGVAGYFQGMVGIYGPATANGSFKPESLARFVGNIDPSLGYVLDVYNQSSTGFAAQFNGGFSVITGSGAGGANPEATLVVRNTNADGGTTLLLDTTPIVNHTPAPIIQYTAGSAIVAGNITYALYAQAGTASNGASSYAAWFHSSMEVADDAPPANLIGLLIKPTGGAAPSGIRFNDSARIKTKNAAWVCPMSADDCSAYGEYVRTVCGPTHVDCTTANAIDLANVQYCYDNGTTAACANVYSAGVRVLEIR